MSYVGRQIQQRNRDRSRVSGDQQWEVGYVASKFGLPTDQVRDLIAEFGNERDLIEREAKKLKQGDERPAA